MTRHRAFNWLLAGLICLALGSLYRLDGPSDIEALQDVAADVNDAIQQSRVSAAQGDLP